MFRDQGELHLALPLRVFGRGLGIEGVGSGSRA